MPAIAIGCDGAWLNGFRRDCDYLSGGNRAFGNPSGDLRN